MKPSLERHIQIQIRAVVDQCPISAIARDAYKK
jgi:hypothetical protein